MAKSVSNQTELFDVAELPGRPMLHWHGKRPLREIAYYPAQTCEGDVLSGGDCAAPAAHVKECHSCTARPVGVPDDGQP